MADFTLARYEQLLRTALDEGYAFVGFCGLDDAAGPAVALRHDIDFSPRWLAPVAAVEEALGIRSTWCLQPSATNYRWDGPAMRAAVEPLLAAGHELALHFDANACGDEAGIVDGVRREASMLAAAYGVEVRVVSFHQVGRRMLSHLELPPPYVNTYAPRFFSEIGYVSDSNMHWRGKDLEAILRGREHRRLQVLTHPMWWREEPVTLLEAMRELAAETGIDVEELLTPEQRALIGA